MPSRPLASRLSELAPRNILDLDRSTRPVKLRRIHFANWVSEKKHPAQGLGRVITKGGWGWISRHPRRIRVWPYAARLGPTKRVWALHDCLIWLLLSIINHLFPLTDTIFIGIHCCQPRLLRKMEVFGRWPRLADATLQKRPNFKPKHTPFGPANAPCVAPIVWDGMPETAPVMVGVSL